MTASAFFKVYEHPNEFWAKSLPIGGEELSIRDAKVILDLNSQQWQRNSALSEHYEPEQAPSTARAMDLYVCYQVHGSQLTVFFTLHKLYVCYNCAAASLGATPASSPTHISLYYALIARVPVVLVALVVFFVCHRVSRQGDAFRESVLLECQQVVISSSIPLSSEHPSLPSLFFNSTSRFRTRK